jgi:uncharacterized protein
VPGIGQLLLAAHAVLGGCPGFGLADAMNVVLAREFRTDVIAARQAAVLDEPVRLVRR